MPTDRQGTAKPCAPLIFNLAMTHMCCFSHLSQTPRLFFQMGGEPKPGRLLRAQQPPENLAPMTNSNTAPAGRLDTTPGISQFEGQDGSHLTRQESSAFCPNPTSSSELSSSYSSLLGAPASAVLRQGRAACRDKGRELLWKSLEVL